MAQQFKPGSIFYKEPSDIKQNDLNLKVDQELNRNFVADPISASSRNSIYYQDFSSYPNSSTRASSTANSPVKTQDIGNVDVSGPLTPSKNSIFEVDLASSSQYQPQSVLLSPQTGGPVTAIQTEFSGSATVAKRSSLSAVLDKLSGNNVSKMCRIQLQDSPSLSALTTAFDCHDHDIVNVDDGITLKLMSTAKNLLGEGRFAKVYRATISGGDFGDEEHLCAVKALHINDEDAETCGLVEAYTLKKIYQWHAGRGHEHIIRLYGVKHELTAYTPRSGRQSYQNSVKKQLMLLLEYCEHGQLFDYILRNQHLVGRRRWIRWCREIASAVKYLHSGSGGIAVMHHDIKPHNILLTQQLETRLSDFGSAVMISLESAPILRDGIGRGTQAYSAPEVLTGGSSPYGLPADIYSLGCTFYALLTGREPFCDIRNPVHQLWCIRKGFFESGINSLQSESTQSSPASLTYSSSTPLASTPKTQDVLSPTMSAHSYGSDHYLLQFLNGDALYSTSVADCKAYELIVGLLRKCTALNPEDRCVIADVIQMLDALDEQLVLGVGVDPQLAAASTDRPISSQSMRDSTSSPTVIQTHNGRKPLIL